MFGPYWIVVWGFALACIIWSFVVIGLAGKIVVGSVVILFVILSISIPEGRLVFEIIGLLFSFGCFFFAYWQTRGAKKGIR